MKTLLKNSYVYKIRNLFGIKPSLFNINTSKLNSSISDGFFWRTDNGYKTLFRFMDLTNFFYEKKSLLEFVFFDKNNQLIKTFLKEINLNNEFYIDSELLNNEGYGVFYVFHKSKDKINSCIRQSCYTGYSLNNNIPSFVHGNTPTTLKDINPENKKIIFGLGGKHIFAKKTYKVQNYINAQNSEILILNPCEGSLKIEVNHEIFFLDQGCSKLINLNKCKTIEIKSKCYLLRPIIFDYYDEFIDVYHG
jgi:hypothetical protein